MLETSKTKSFSIYFFVYNIIVQEESLVFVQKPGVNSYLFMDLSIITGGVNMKKILSILLIGILFISVFGTVAVSENKTNC